MDFEQLNNFIMRIQLHILHIHFSFVRADCFGGRQPQSLQYNETLVLLNCNNCSSLVMWILNNSSILIVLLLGRCNDVWHRPIDIGH